MTKVIVVLTLTALLAGTADQLVAHTNQDGPADQGWVETLIFLDQTFDLIEFSFLTNFLNTPCAEEAIDVCGKGKVCWLCTCWDGDGGGHCSFGCDTGTGCQPAPPCSCHMLFSG